MTNLSNRIIYFSLLVLLMMGQSYGQPIPFPAEPDWQSTPLNYYSTGLGIADINGDGWQDIIVANGNDMAQQDLVVYYNQGDGRFPRLPDWKSQDRNYHGHLSVGDINNDGWNDVAVSVFLGPNGFKEYGWVKVYFNQGGTLESLPSYQCEDRYFNFSCVLGDADGDGDLDLAVAGGQPYAIDLGPQRTFGRIYYNENGALQTRPGWQSHELMAALDVDFADLDQNGFLDLVFANHLTPNYAYLADSTGRIDTTAAWHSGDPSYFANSLDLGRVDDDSYPDLIVSDNNQLGGLGRFKLYAFAEPFPTATEPVWTSAAGGYGSGVLLTDVNLDGHLDLVAGQWWSPLYFFAGTGTGFNAVPDFTTRTNSVIEAIVIADLDQDDLVVKSDTVRITHQEQAVVTLKEQTIEAVISVQKNHRILDRIEYQHLPLKNWLTFSERLRQGDIVVIQYQISRDGDLVVSNWDKSIGNYIFYNRTTVTAVDQTISDGFQAQIEINGPYPNPFNSQTIFQIQVSAPAEATLNVYSLSGQWVESRSFQIGANGKHFIPYRLPANLASGCYLYQWRISDYRLSGKLLFLK